MAQADAAATTPGQAADPDALLEPGDRAELETRWSRIEERFVDDPAATVRAAEEHVGDVIERLRTALDRRRVAVGERAIAVDEATTEQLREVLHRYRQLAQRLMRLPVPDGPD